MSGGDVELGECATWPPTKAGQDLPPVHLPASMYVVPGGRHVERHDRG
jgi:hypothetical protein